MEQFHNRLKRLREECGLTARELARRIDVPETTYREWEYGRQINGQPYVKIAAALEVSLVELMTGGKSSREDLLEGLGAAEAAIREVKRRLLLSP